MICFFGYNTSPNSVVHFEFVIFFINDFRDSLIPFQGNNAKTPLNSFLEKKIEVLVVQCEAIRSEQFENGHFSKAYKLMNIMFKQVLSKKTFARHEYGQVEVFRIKMRPLVQKL